MSKEQIEEMASIAYPGLDHQTVFSSIVYAQPLVNLYNAGYRKQSEGEWVPCDVLPADEDGEWTSYACSMCKHTTDSYYRDVNDLSRYCPNCGAKMKGGE